MSYAMTNSRNGTGQPTDRLRTREHSSGRQVGAAPVLVPQEFRYAAARSETEELGLIVKAVIAMLLCAVMPLITFLVACCLLPDLLMIPGNLN